MCRVVVPRKTGEHFFVSFPHLASPGSENTLIVVSCCRWNYLPLLLQITQTVLPLVNTWHSVRFNPVRTRQAELGLQAELRREKHAAVLRKV